MSQLFSAGLRDKIAAVVGRYPRKQAGLLPVLHLVQGELGFISSAAEKAVADLLDLKPIQVREVVTFLEAANHGDATLPQLTGAVRDWLEINHLADRVRLSMGSRGYGSG